MNDSLPVHFAEDAGTSIDAFGAVGALELMRGLADVDAHRASADTFGAVDAHVLGIVKVNQQRVLVGKHVLEVAIGADSGAESLAKESKVKEGDGRNCSTEDAARGTNVKAHQSMEEIQGWNKIRDEDKGEEHRRGDSEDVHDSFGDPPAGLIR